MRLAELRRFPLGVFPTPLQRAARLSEATGTQVLIKRDDLTGLGLGGNKVRKLEYLVADALAEGADVLVTGGGRQSNHAALTALAARRAGMVAHLVFYGSPSNEDEGNAVLNTLTGATITYTGHDDRASVDRCLDTVAAELRSAGRRPYVIPRGGATPLGCVGYVRASLELAVQLAERDCSPALLVLATGSCGTQAGLALGATWLQATYRVVGVTVSRPRDECLDRIAELGGTCAELLGLDGGEALELEVLDGYLGPGYGQGSDRGRAAMELIARTEGLVLDPVFTAKAMAALLDLAGEVSGPIVFLHSGGAPTVFVGTHAEGHA